MPRTPRLCRTWRSWPTTRRAWVRCLAGGHRRWGDRARVSPPCTCVRRTAGARSGHTLYDCHMDRAYRYTFSEECILALFGRGGFPAAHVPALHLALVHSPDASLALRVRRA